LKLRVDLIGKRFGRLSVVSAEGCNKRGAMLWKCKCDCGNESHVTTTMLNRGKTKSCGCLNRELASERMKKVQLLTHTHDMTQTRFYSIYRGMRARCEYPNDKSYARYGGRGIEVCKNWNSFENFKDDMYGSYLNHVSLRGARNTTLERIFTDGNYELSNCKWANHTEQANNRRNNRIYVYDGEKLTMAQLSRKYNIPYSTLQKRFSVGWDLHDAVSRRV
jgi:hypothetical protein